MNKDTITSLYNNVEELRMVHFDTIDMQHGINDGGIWKIYNPTHFMYMYAFFNTLYAIDWEVSMENGEMISQPEKTSERTKISQMLSFCFTDPSFKKKYKSDFIRIITNVFSSEKINRIIDTIKPDATHSLGQIGENEKYSFKRNVFALLNGEFSTSIVYKIMEFIFLIRNNIFHGTKTLYTMLEPKQQTKLLLYSYFIIAVNQMLFSYLDYLYEKHTGKKVEEYNIDTLNKILKKLKANSQYAEIEDDEDNYDDNDEI